MKNTDAAEPLKPGGQNAAYDRGDSQRQEPDWEKPMSRRTRLALIECADQKKPI